MQTAVEQYLAQRLEGRKSGGNLRQLPSLQNDVDFYSNDYLGLAKNGLSNLAGYPAHNGSTGSRLLSGNSAEAEALEEYLAGFHQAEKTLLFNSGYDANTGLIAAIANRHTIILYDELSHASIIDGIRLSFCKQSFRFRHNDITDLENKLKKYSAADIPVIVVVESVYSMEGDIAPLENIASLCKKHRAALVVDEAHATGVFGKNGEGMVQQLRLQDEVFARVHTFGKALGAHGAIVAGSNLLIHYLVNFARSFIYTTALPPQTAMHVHQNYQLLQTHPEIRKELHDRIYYFNACKKNIAAAHWLESTSPIQSLIVSNSVQTKALAQHCRENGMLVSAILSPTVAAGSERIRICLHSFNTKEEIDLLLNHIQICLEK